MKTQLSVAMGEKRCVNATITDYLDSSFDHKDIWSLGITFCEMATAKSPFKNAAAAIYAVCVSKQYPPLPRDLSEDAVTFLAR